jgi:hypothetical protein
MSDHTSPFEGSDSPSRQRSPTPGDPKYHYESLNDIGKSSATSAPYTRRRPSRTSSGSKGTPPSASPPRGDDHDESEQRNKPPRNTLKKLLRRDSHHTDTGSTSQGKQEELDEDGSTIGYMPRLGQIKESKSKVSTQTRHRGSSVVSSSADAKVLRRRHTGDNAVKRSHTRDKRSSLQRHAGNMANISDPSLVSSVTQQSDVSGDSNSTVLQRPYSGYDQVAQYLEPDESHSPSASTTVESPALNSMSSTQPAVFQYLQSSDDTGENFTPTPTDLQAMPPSTIASSSSSSSSGDIQHDDGRSSVAADSQHTIDSPMTSPASTRRSFKTSSHLPNQGFRNSTQQLNPTQSKVLTPKPKRTPTTASTPVPKQKNEAHPRGPHSPRRCYHGCALRGGCARPRCRRRSRGQEVSPCWRCYEGFHEVLQWIGIRG